MDVYQYLKLKEIDYRPDWFPQKKRQDLLELDQKDFYSLHGILCTYTHPFISISIGA